MFCLSMAGSSKREFILETKNPKRDLSKAFFQRLQERTAQDNLTTLVEKIKELNLKVIIAPGFISGLGKIGGQRNLSNLANSLERMGLVKGFDFAFAPFNTFQGVEYNAKKLADFVTAAYSDHGKKSLIIGHSMGGLHTEKMLFDYPETRKMVHRFVGLQNPWKGSLVADKIEEIVPTRIFMHTLLRVFTRSLNREKVKMAKKALIDLQVKERGRFYSEHYQDWQEVQKEVIHLEYATHFPKEKESVKKKLNYHSIYSLLVSFFRYFHHGQDNDYFVARASQVRDESMYYVEDEGDHLSVVMSNQTNGSEERVEKLSALLLLALSLEN